MNIKVAEAMLRLRRIPIDLSGMSVGEIMRKYKVKRGDAKELKE